MRLFSPSLFRLRLIPITAALVFVIGIEGRAQSGDARSPTPVRANEIVDSIAARDLGDSRLTDYFYTFTGLPGDLLITLESKNLNGDIDVFTAGELRPLLKITFYAENTTPSTKNIYLRKRQSLILRIEARTPSDDPGTYRIHFSGSFEPISAGALASDSEKPPETNSESSKPSDRRTTRVSSVGARLEEPPPEVAAASAPKPTPKVRPSPVPEKPASSEPPKSTAKTPPARRPAPRRVSPKPKPPAATATAKDSTKGSSTGSSNNNPSATATTKPSETASSAKPPETNTSAGVAVPKKPESAKAKPAPPRRAVVRKAPVRKPAATPAPQPENQGRLVIEQKDGTRREFPMSNVRKVTVENGEIVVIDNDGQTERISMTTVARMSIGP